MRVVGRACGVALVLGAIACGLARADEGRLLHEYVPDVEPNEAVIALGQGESRSASVVYHGEALAPESTDAASESMPPFSATPGDGELGEAPGQRSQSFRPDRLTELEGALDYYEAFTPAIAPFKRVTSLDATRLDTDGVTPVLGVRNSRRHEVPVEGADSKPPDARARDRFWGEVMLDFRSAALLPLPSVSPESRILNVQTTPSLRVRIERDGADNYYVRLLAPPPAAPVRMVFLTDAPRSYFGAEIPHAKVSVLASEVPPLDPSIARRTRAFAAELGLSEASDLHAALHTLTRYFRQWNESAEPPPNTGDLYSDLVHAKKGVCRHRAYAFVVTAQALGIPARFLQNEAHSWVEVKLPTTGFLRIDLGGAAHGLTTHGASDRPVYTPAQPDTLPRPESYRQSYSTLQQGVTGLRPKPEDVMGRWVSPSESSSTQTSSVFMAGPQPGGRPDSSGRKPLAIMLKNRQVSVLRGGKLSLTGRLTNEEGRGVRDLRIEISIAATQRKDRMLLGVTVTDDDGYFRASLGVPPDLPVGDYKLVVLTPGDARYLPVVAQ